MHKSFVARGIVAGLTAGGVDGSIWFTEYDAHTIGQLVLAGATPQGQATEVH
jgi:hypothetical protein